MISLDRIFPFLTWRSRVNQSSLRDDLIAAFIGAMIVLPQGVAFATLAGMPPQYGLYAAMVPAVIAALWGSSWHLVSGPTNAISLVTFAIVSTLADPGSERYIQFVLTLTFMVGLMQLAMGIARLGTIVNFISHTVIVGFTAGAALLIISSQIKNFFGLDIPRGTSFFHVFEFLFTNLLNIKPWVFAVSMITLLTGIIFKKWIPKIPYMIAAMLIGGLCAWLLNKTYGQDVTGIKTLGALPSALPPISTPQFDMETIRTLIGAAIAVTALALTEAVAIARSLAVKSGQRIDGNQEFVGQGLSNIAGAFFSAYPSSGSFNRSGVNYEAGAKTPLAAVFSVPFLITILFFVAPLAAYLPIASMAAILFLVAWGLFDFHHIHVIWRSSKSESLVLIVTFVACLMIHLEYAILVGVALSMMLFLMRTSQPVVRTLLPQPHDPQRKFAPVEHGQQECPQIKIVRVEGALYFGAVNNVSESLAQFSEQYPQQKIFLLMGKSINFVDIAGAELLVQEAKKRAKEGGKLLFYSLRQGALEMLTKPDYATVIKNDLIFQTKHEAVKNAVAACNGSICAKCEIRAFKECAQQPNDALLK